MKIPIGVILKTIMDEKGLKAQDVADKLGLTRQSVYQCGSKIEMSDGEIKRWANALGVTYDEIINRWKGDGVYKSSGSDLLSEQIAKIEKIFREQLEIKDQQIEALTKMIDNNQRTIEALLGKSKGVANEPMCRIIPLLGNGNTFGHTQPAA